MEPEVDIGYAWAQLRHAQRTVAAHPDPDVRSRAAASVTRWERVIGGMIDGSVVVGSRTPTAAPAWVTLEVVTGGFATGGYEAGGPLRDHERALATELGLPATRLALNLAHCAGPRASALLASGHYRIDVPEEGALLVVAWLAERGQVDGARKLLDVLTPWFHRLRFYPRPAADALPARIAVRLQDLAATVAQLDRPRRQPRVEAMTAALTLWTPLRDRAIALALATCDGEPPRRTDRGVVGGRLGVVRPAGWDARVLALAADVAAAGAPATARGRGAVALTDRQIAATRGTASLADDGWTRHLVASQVAAHGVPGTDAHAARRAAAAAAVRAPLHADLRRVLVTRLRGLPDEGGVELDEVTGPVDDDEAARTGVPAGSALPPYLIARAARSWETTLTTLVERRVVPSAEVLAKLVPQVTAQLEAERMADAAAGRLYRDIYTAFRRRRGLLLLGYTHQVRLTELPWAAPLEADRPVAPAASARADAVLAEVATALVTGFPQTIVPNKLVPELRALTEAAGRTPPLVEELAADIFMGSFTGKFVMAARTAAALLADRLYLRYYAIDRHAILALPRSNPYVSHELGALCGERVAHVEGGRGSGNVGNGQIIEQAQILTTHNLAVLFELPGVAAALAPRLRALAEQTFRWIVRQLRIDARGGHEVLTRMKNVAYAWRQLVFFLSFVDDVAGFVGWARARVAQIGPGLADRVAPLLRGLELAAAGVGSDDPAFAAGGGRVLTGWSRVRPWLAPPAPAVAPRR